MRWKMAIGGAVTAAVGVLFLGSGGGGSAWLGFALLLAGVLSVTVGMLLHIGRRMRELARELNRLRAELMRRWEAAKDETTGDEPE
ncbi:MAG: hypothetical protein ACYSU0_07980 [Planctomycetota bacterium]|jgi:hypothetical protein